MAELRLLAIWAYLSPLAIGGDNTHFRLLEEREDIIDFGTGCYYFLDTEYRIFEAGSRGIYLTVGQCDILDSGLAESLPT